MKKSKNLKKICLFFVVSVSMIATMGLKSQDLNQDLIRAAAVGALDQVKTLLQKKAAINAQDEYGYTPLIEATYENKIEVLKELLRHGSNVNIKDKHGRTALFWAVNQGNLEAVTLLMKIPGIQVNIQENREGLTPLMRAVYLRHKEIVKELLKDPYVDFTLKDDEFDTALDVALRSTEKEIASLIRKAKARQSRQRVKFSGKKD